MRFSHRLITLLLLSCCAFGAVVNTTVDCKEGGENPCNKVTSTTCNATENTITILITPGKARTVMFVNGQDWVYRSATGGTDLSVSANQALTLKFKETTTVYHIRNTADGAVKIVPLE